MSIGVLVIGLLSVLTRGPLVATQARPAKDPDGVDQMVVALGSDPSHWRDALADDEPPKVAPTETPEMPTPVPPAGPAVPVAAPARRPRRPCRPRPSARPIRPTATDRSCLASRVVFTGGTISTAFDPAAGGRVPLLDGAAILARTPGLDAIAEVVAIDRGRMPASHLSFAELIELAGVVRDALADPSIDGAVVVQGTDTIEETAFCWDLLLDGPKPVVVTGAMRASDEPGFDGPANLRDAVVAAASGELRGQGVVVTLGGTLEPADDVQKMHATALTPFGSPNGGSLGRVSAAGVALVRRRTGRRHVATTRAAERVHLITATVGMDGSLLDAAVAAGADGIVVAATGSGNTSEPLRAAAQTAIESGVPVVLTTRCLAGAVVPAYAFAGGGATWVRSGAILAGHLCGPKARVALALGLGAGLDRDGLAALLADPVA